jgi:hypothetical protein
VLKNKILIKLMLDSFRRKGVKGCFFSFCENISLTISCIFNLLSMFQTFANWCWSVGFHSRLNISTSENLNYCPPELNFCNATIQQQKPPAYYVFRSKRTVKENVHVHVPEFRTASMQAPTWVNSPLIFEWIKMAHNNTAFPACHIE